MCRQDGGASRDECCFVPVTGASFQNALMQTATDKVMTLKIRGEACDQLEAMADAGDRTLTKQLARVIRNEFARFQQERNS